MLGGDVEVEGMGGGVPVWRVVSCGCGARTQGVASCVVRVFSRVSLDFIFGLRASVLGLRCFSGCDSLLWLLLSECGQGRL